MWVGGCVGEDSACLSTVTFLILPKVFYMNVSFCVVFCSNSRLRANLCHLFECFGLVDSFFVVATLSALYGHRMTVQRATLFTLIVAF